VVVEFRKLQWRGNSFKVAIPKAYLMQLNWNKGDLLLLELQEDGLKNRIVEV